MGCRTSLARTRRTSRHLFANRLLLLGGARATASGFFAAIQLVGNKVRTCAVWHGDFTLPGHGLAELDGSRDHQDQRKSATDDPDSNLDRKWVCDADGMTKKYQLVFPSVVLRAAGE